VGGGVGGGGAGSGGVGTAGGREGGMDRVERGYGCCRVGYG
jgi:hypothetical protein